VLKGDLDPQFERWGKMKQISPENVGPEEARERGPVLEERQVPHGKYEKGDVGRIAASEWEEVARQYRTRLQRLNDPRTSQRVLFQRGATVRLADGRIAVVASVEARNTGSCLWGRRSSSSSTSMLSRARADPAGRAPSSSTAGTPR